MGDTLNGVGGAVADLTAFGNIKSDLIVAGAKTISSGLSTAYLGVSGSLETIKDIIKSPLKGTLDTFVASIGNAFAPNLPVQVSLPNFPIAAIARFKNYSIPTSASISGAAGSIASAALSSLKTRVDGILSTLSTLFG